MYRRLLNSSKICVLISHQYGFRKNLPTNFSLIDLTDKITSAIGNKEFVVGVFLDLSKAFDTVNNNLLLLKLEFHGIKGIPLDWFKNYILQDISASDQAQSVGGDMSCLQKLFLTQRKSRFSARSLFSESPACSLPSLSGS